MKNKQRKKHNLVTITVFSWICIIGLIFVIFNGVEMIWKFREYSYYKDRSNFIEVTSDINHVVWTHSEKRLNLAFSNLPDGFSDENFCIKGDNYVIVADNDGEECLELGDTITFVTAPRYFGDGYTMPIIAIRIKDKTLLEFEDGYKNLIESYYFWK